MVPCVSIVGVLGEDYYLHIGSILNEVDTAPLFAVKDTVEYGFDVVVAVVGVEVVEIYVFG